MTDTTGGETRIRIATAADAETVARLHAASWRRHYRGAYADAYLDGDVVADRLAVWSQRLEKAEGTLTLLAEHTVATPDGDDAEPLGFLHIVFDDDPAWGSLVDNLHITLDRQRTGVGRALLTRAAQAAAEEAQHRGLYLWVLEQNVAAQSFYRALGGAFVEKAIVTTRAGVAVQLVGEPVKLRCAWPDAASVGVNVSVSGEART